MANVFAACAISDCDGNAHYTALGRKGFCSSHYTRLMRHGDPLAGRTPQGDPLRFIHDVAIPHKGKDCLTWPFGTNSNGYATVRVEGTKVEATRYVCERVHGPPPTPAHQAAHSCGKGHEACINPNHLSWKTPSGNNQDKVEHGTHHRGERSSTAKLTEEQVREILLRKGTTTEVDLAAEFGVHRSTINAIHRRRTWFYLEPLERAHASSLPETANLQRDVVRRVRRIYRRT